MIIIIIIIIIVIIIIIIILSSSKQINKMYIIVVFASTPRTTTTIIIIIINIIIIGTLLTLFDKLLTSIGTVCKSFLVVGLQRVVNLLREVVIDRPKELLHTICIQLKLRAAGDLAGQSYGFYA